MVCRCYSLHSCSPFQVAVRYLYLANPFAPHCGANTLLISTLFSATTEIPQATYDCFWVSVHVHVCHACVIANIPQRKMCGTCLTGSAHLCIDSGFPTCSSLGSLIGHLYRSASTRQLAFVCQGAPGPACTEHVPPLFKWSIPFPPLSKSLY